MKNIVRNGVLVCVCMGLLATTAQGLAKTDYVLDTDGKTKIRTPETHAVVQVINFLGKEAGMFSNPTDLFIDAADFIYVADAGNNRIVKLSPEGEYLSSFTDGGKLREPSGVFVDEYGDLFIADTANERIVHLDGKGTFIEEFQRPTSDLLKQDLDFRIQRLGLSQQGYLYVIKGQKFMVIDANNDFKGYIGANQLGFSFKRMLIQLFASKEQKDKMIIESAPPYNSFDVGDDGMLYATTSEAQSSGQIVRINAAGENMYPAKAYGEVYFNEETKQYNNAKFVDIAVDRFGILCVLEQHSGQVYLYDQEGQLLSVFGGKGQKKGYYTLPVALDVNSKGDTFVLDGSVGCIHRFQRTDFLNTVIDAVAYYDEGKYNDAYMSWQTVLQTDVNYPPANIGIAKSLYKAGREKEAMKYYQYGDDKAGYSSAFVNARYKSFRQQFGWVVLGTVLLAGGLLLGVVLLKKKADKTVKDYFGSRHG